MSVVKQQAIAIQNDPAQRQADFEILRAENFERWAAAITGTHALMIEVKASYLRLALECRVAADLILSTSKNQ